MADITNLDEKARNELASLMLDLAHDKDFRPVVGRELAKRGKPLADVQESDMRNTITAEFAARDEAARAERILAQQEAQRNGLVASGRYKPEQIAEIEGVMQKYGISDYDAGAKIYAADQKPAAPTSELKTRTWQMPQIEQKDLGNLKQHSLDKAYSVVDELRGRRPH